MEIGTKKFFVGLILLIALVGFSGWYWYSKHVAIGQLQAEQHVPSLISGTILEVIDDTHLLVRISEQIKSPDGTFINYYKKNATLSPMAKAFSPKEGQFVPVPIRNIEAPADAYLDFEADKTNPDNGILYGIYLNE